MWKFWISLILLSPQVAWAWCENYAIGTEVATLADEQLSELSGLARSSRTNHYWAHNDSGDSARLFHFGEDGRVEQVQLTSGGFDIDVQDWEDLSNAPCLDGSDECLLIADFGDNLKRRPYVQFVLGRPNSDNNAIETQKVFNTTYPNAESMDAEGLIVWEDSAFIFSKEGGISRVFRFDLSGPAQQESELVAEIPLPLVTAADISEDGQKIIVRGYIFIREYSVTNGDIVAALSSEPKSIRMTSEQQGEAVAYRSDGPGFITVGEKVNARVIVYTCEPVVPAEDMGAEPDIGSGDLGSSPAQDVGVDLGSESSSATGTSSCSGGFLFLPFLWRPKRRVIRSIRMKLLGL